MDIDVTGKNAILKLTARCDASYSKEIFTIIHDEKYSDLEELIIDFSNTVYIDSSTIGVLVTISRKYSERNAKLIISNLSEDIDELFSDTGLDLIFNILDSKGNVEDASVDIFAKSIEIRLDIVKEEVDDVCIFHLSGVMNNPTGSRFFKQQILLAITEFKKVLIDFNQLTFFDSLSVGVLISMYKLLQKTGGSIKFCRTNYIVEDLFNTLNINNIISVFETIDDALNSWKDER